MEYFFRKGNFSQMREMDFMELKNVGSIFSLMCEQEWPNLEKIRLPSIGDFDPAILKKKDLFPSLKTATLDVADVGNEILIEFLVALQAMAPNLE